MMLLELNESEEKVLADTLDSSLSMLGNEISHTDTYEYREFLKERKEILVSLRKKLH
jgi:hypothetical protein